jgi:hypothetical protein
LVSESIMSVNDIVSFEHQVSLAQDARITAYYGSVIAGQLEAFARCQDYPRHVADSILYCWEGRW